jgi:hypothetical protein
VSAAWLAAETRAAPAPDQVGEIAAAWQVGPGALLLLGWQRDPPAPEGTAALQRADGTRGRFTRFAWPARIAGAAAYQFLAAVHLPKVEAQGGDALALTGRRAADGGVVAHLPARLAEPAAFGAELARAAGGAAPAVARFLLGLFPSVADAGSAALCAMLASFLDAASEPDGCVEIVGALRDRCAVMQGWGRPVEAQCEAVLLGTTLARHPIRAAAFARPDITGAATGQVLVLPPVAAQAGAVTAVFLLARDSIRRRPVLAQHRALTEDETAGHLRDILPALRCDAATRAALLAALRPRYEGRLTLTDAGHPVRLGLDLAAAAPGAGLYLTGWLYDPAGVVEAVHLRGTGGGSARLDDGWTRIPRDDVTEAFRGEPGLPAAEGDGHGFAVHVPRFEVGREGEALYLDVGFRDGGCGFVPLPPLGSASDAATRRRLLASVDLHKPSGLPVIERQLAPFLSRLTGRPAPRPASPAAPGTWTCPIVVPLAEAELPRAFLAQFLGDPLAAHEGVLFACGDAWTDGDAGRLAALARFYGVLAVVVRVEGAATAGAALDAAAAASDAGRFLLAGPGTIGRTPGWRDALARASGEHEGGAACVSPTVLYEDESIRFAGLGGVAPREDAPYVELARPFAGLPPGFAPAGPPAPTAGVSAACCLVPRAALLADSPGAALAAEPEMDLLLRVRRAGVACLWAPAIQVHATEDDPAPDGAANRVGRLVARWSLRALLAAEE